MYIDPLTDKESQTTIDVAGQKFALIVRPSYEVLHGRPEVHPINGTAACWAESRKPKIQAIMGFLTAKHVLAGRGIGEPMETTAGKGKVMDLAPDSIDAALVAPPGTVMKKAGKPLPCLSYVAQFTDVQFEGMGSRQPVKTKVTEVWFRDANDPNPSLPGRIFLAWPGAPGDSGALVRDTAGNGIGIYILAARSMSLPSAWRGSANILAKPQESCSAIFSNDSQKGDHAHGAKKSEDQ